MKKMLKHCMIVVAFTLIATAISPAPHAEASFMKPEQADDAALHEQILKLVETYAPSELTRWKEELAERRELRSKMNELKQSRDFQKKHEEIKDEWRQKIEKGEMSREEMKKMMEKKHKEFKEKRQKWKEEGKMLNEQLAEAVKKGDEKSIHKTLEAMLTRLVQANDMLSEKLKQFK